jgi:KaiC/GvpD/RAD55 family RecA-like ATPase/predicted hydrocarbon binding protein
MGKIVSTGDRDLDGMMGGGLLQGNAHLLEVEPGTGEMAFIATFLDDGIRHGELCAVVGYDRPHEDIITRLKEFGFDAEEPLRSGSLLIADLCNEGKYDPDHTGPILMTENLYDPNSMLRLYYDLVQITDKNLKSGKYAGARAVVYSLSSQIMNYKFEAAYKAVKKAIQMARQSYATSITTLNPGMFEETVVAAFEHLFDGTIVLTMKEVKGRFQKFIRVKESPVAEFYSDEVPYEIVDSRPCLLTSFSEPIQKFRHYLKFNADGTITLAGLRFLLSNAVLVNSILEQAVKLLGYKTTSEQVYNLYKTNGQAELGTLLKATNVSLGSSSPKQILEMFANYISANGSGITEMTEYTDEGMTFEVRHSLCSLSEKSDKPMGQYLAGALAGAAELVLGKKVQCTETKCVAKGDNYCQFVCKVIP